MEIQMKQSHIDKGVAYSDTQCPVAQALNQATGLYAKVSDRYITLKDPQTKKTLWRRRAPVAVCTFILRFDKWGRGHVSPITFRISYQPGGNDADPSETDTH